MGPRLQERGVRRKSGYKIIGMTLQWGRAYKSAEFRFSTLICIKSKRLQWGRAYKSAELGS